jgi:U2 small nuclear ribonucleoprotein A'
LISTTSLTSATTRSLLWRASPLCRSSLGLISLRTLNLTNNHISTIENISDAFPNLENLVLLGNRLSSLQELDNLSYCRNLTRLYLLNNPITEDPNYRYYVIHRVPTLKVLDFQRIKKEEREKATKLYGELSLLSQKEKLAKMTKKDKIKVEDRVT